MNIRPNSITLPVADYCNAHGRQEVLVDKNYQRNARVWPERAQSYLIETILLGFPMPKLALHQQTDLKSRRSLKYVVDGQQRTNAIVDFFNGKLRLSNSLELEAARGKTFDSLTQDLQEAFLSYPLQFDQFEAADSDVVREYFRRINSFTTPLNAEERRHAIFQGNMKWFILKLAERHTETFVSLQTMTEREIVRMADHKLFAELVHALLNGVRTTNSKMLDGLYRMYDTIDIPHETQLREAIDAAFNWILGWRELRQINLVQKSYLLYSLVLAVISVDKKWSALLPDDIDYPRGVIHPNAEQNFLALSDAIISEDTAGPFKSFIEASSEKTNTRDQRQTRIRFLAAAITNSNC